MSYGMFKILEWKQLQEKAHRKSDPSCVSIHSDACTRNPMNLKMDTSSHCSSLEPSPCVSCESDVSEGLPMNFKADTAFEFSLQRHKPAPVVREPKDFSYKRPDFCRSPQTLFPPDPEHSPMSVTTQTPTSSPLNKDEGSSFKSSPQTLLSPESPLLTISDGSIFSPRSFQDGCSDVDSSLQELHLPGDPSFRSPSDQSKNHPLKSNPQPLLSPDPEHSPMSVTTQTPTSSPLNKDEGSSFKSSPQTLLSPESPLLTISDGSIFSPRSFQDGCSDVDSRVESQSLDSSSCHPTQLKSIFKLVFIFDGLDECRLPLDFIKTKALTDPTESVSVEVLLVNLIRGTLLPSARLWITTRPAAANQIPAKSVSMVTEVRGFTGPQKEQYFRKRFTDQQQATAVLSHITKSCSLNNMCYIPVFCWIISTVIEKMIKKSGLQKLPDTLTQIYIHFLVVLLKQKNVKYDEESEAESAWSLKNKKMVESLGKLAFEQLQKGNLIFYESDLRECGIDITAASVYSGVFTEVFKEQLGLYQDKIYHFVHLSVQEFLAALHVHLTFLHSGVNLLCESQSPVESVSAEVVFYQTSINQALQSPNGHLDLFLRFLLGLSLDTNQIFLQGLLPKSESTSKTNKEMAQFIKAKLNQNLSVERCINLFHCLRELKDHSLVNQIQWYLNSGRLKTDKLSASQWSALVFILLSSEKEELNLKEYCASEEGLMRLLPVVKASKKAVLSGCSLLKLSCTALSSLLSSESCHLKELDLSNNNLTDAGIEELAPGLKSPHCKLETLSLSGCLITEKGCTTLASALRCNPSHLRVLDLNYNHPGDKGLKELFALQSIPQCNLKTIRVELAGHHWLIPDLKKYFVKITFDPNTVNKRLQLFKNNMKVGYALKCLLYPNHPERFECWPQVLCSTELTGRCYQELDWTGDIEIGITYKRIRRKGNNEICRFGANDHSFRLRTSSKGCYVCRRNKKVPVKQIAPNRVGVYVDYPAGILSFFSVSPDTRFLLYTVHTTFTEPLYMGIGVRERSDASFASLCDLSHELSILKTP